jgi:hypothetical protein
MYPVPLSAPGHRSHILQFSVLADTSASGQGLIREVKVPDNFTLATRGLKTMVPAADLV